MGVRVLESKDGHHAVLYCSTTYWAFGPVFADTDNTDAANLALAFIKWLPQDARLYPDNELERKYSEFITTEANRAKST